MAKPSDTYADKLKAVRDLMKAQGLDAFIVPRADEYQGEFVAPYAERLKWLTGFTGSGGTALIFKKKAIVLTDGRYLIQVDSQVDNTLFETGEYVKKKTHRWLEENIKQGNVVGYDPYLHTPKQIESLSKACKNKGAYLKPVSDNVIDSAWHNQPPKPDGKVALFPEEIAGIPSKEKIKNVVNIINKKDAQAFIFTLPDSISWLLNIRGSDIDYIPSVLSYLLVTHRGNVRWFVDPKKLSPDILKALGKKITPIAPKDMNVQFMALAQASRERERPILMDRNYTPIKLENMLKNRGASVQHMDDPTIAEKARKTPSEIAAIRKAHIHDGVALVKFLKWLEESGGATSEITATDRLYAFRSGSAAFKGNSFPTIAGFGENAAIVHYRASEDTNKNLEQGNLLLIDSGGQYAEGKAYGTTDITRTIAIGEPSEEMRENNTRVLKGHIGVATAKFPKGTIGAQIDSFARRPLWDKGMDFAHGTGHGVGCFLAVHEEAASISSRGQKAFEPGMLISNEPGYYKEGEYGIRIENLIFVVEAEDGMLEFETISFAPLDKTLINIDMLSDEERGWVNDYHSKTYDILSKHLDSEHMRWLAAKTSAI